MQYLHRVLLDGYEGGQPCGQGGDQRGGHSAAASSGAWFQAASVITSGMSLSQANAANPATAPDRRKPTTMARVKNGANS